MADLLVKLYELPELEPCPAILARTAGLALVTDDNMGTEWRFVFGIE